MSAADASNSGTTSNRPSSPPTGSIWAALTACTSGTSTASTTPSERPNPEAPTAYITAPPGAAERTAHQLVEDRPAACVNILDCQSAYRWDDEKRLLLAKTTDDGYEALEDRVAELHPYDVPSIERFEEADLLDSLIERHADATQ